VENYPGFPEPILGVELCDRFRQQSVRYGTRILTETINALDLRHGPPFVLESDATVVSTESVIIATGAAAKKLPIKGLEQYWNNGISACAVCDGSSPLFRCALRAAGAGSACDWAWGCWWGGSGAGVGGRGQARVVGKGNGSATQYAVMLCRYLGHCSRSALGCWRGWGVPNRLCAWVLGEGSSYCCLPPFGLIAVCCCRRLGAVQEPTRGCDWWWRRGHGGGHVPCAVRIQGLDHPPLRLPGGEPWRHKTPGVSGCGDW